MVSLAIRSALFTIVVPGAGAVLVPWWILNTFDPTATATAWPAVVLIALGAAVYLWCVWLFAAVGGGTPGPWDSPQRFVAVGPYRWVRNPIYVASIVLVLGEAWLFEAPALLVYVAAMVIVFHLFVISYEEPTLRRRFGDDYLDYQRRVPRWLPRPPRAG
jgi:protein-S-isoprenylcysteine O-methyltransferase Ste14